MRDQSACPSFAAAFQPQIVTGASTAGYQGVLFTSGDTERVFLDLANHLLPQANPGCTGLVVGFGAPAFSTKVWSLNPEN